MGASTPSAAHTISEADGPADRGGETGAELSVMAFKRDLPELLRGDAGRWVAYAHGKRLRVAATQTELYRHCLKELGLSHEDFIVCCIVPDSGGKVEYTPR